ncbi:hypothetical protein AVEN_9336-1 [Araneus ventricosus]|uniref:Integrase catalytic domain-containing protein n=1 Tax=Araneus ventricosus TaxID=182803 RepID=A0A4Y2DL61_ARAVE|nr:hypothetical protein AVEN_9336-1 [Araneus ventricosus]
MPRLEKDLKKRTKGRLQRYNVGAPIERMALNILGPFPVTRKGNRYVLVLMDYFTKWPEAIPIPNQGASTVAEKLVRSWISCYGVPMILHSDEALASATWNYTESGHGKGAPGGIGSIIKQSADKALAEGNDIPDVDALFTVMRERCTGVFVTTVSKSDITVIEKSLPQNIKPLVGTMQVHQISWCKAKPSSIDARSLSCFKYKPGDKCIHYHIKSHSYQDEMVDNCAIKVIS